MGAKRFTFLSRMFQERYGEVHVLTPNEKYFLKKDYSLQGSGTVHSTGMCPSYYPLENRGIFKKIFDRLWQDYICILDPSSGWILPAVFKGRKIIKENDVDVIIATGPPFSAMVIGYVLSLITKAKLILDYRDPWTNHSRRFCRLFGRKVNELFEKLATRRAYALVFCSRKMKEDFVRDLGKYTKATSHVIPNAFNHKDGIEPLPLGPTRKNMLYVGSFYGERSIELLANPMVQLLSKNLVTKDSFCLHIFGSIPDREKKIIDKYGLQEMVKEHPRVPHQKSFQYLKGADILLLISGSDVKYAVPFKFYDYLSVRKPIFAVAPPNSAVAELMGEIDCGRLAFVDSQDSIRNTLEKMILEDRRYSFSGMEKYTWDVIAKRYIELIESTI